MVETGHTNVSGTRPTNWVCSPILYCFKPTCPKTARDFKYPTTILPKSLVYIALVPSFRYIYLHTTFSIFDNLVSYSFPFLSLNYFHFTVQHSGIPHVALSSWALLTFGPKVCRDYGLFTFCLIYILGGVSGNLMSFLHTPDPTVGGTVS